MQYIEGRKSFWRCCRALVGLVIPAENDGGAIIAYIGIVPEYRGHVQFAISPKEILRIVLVICCVKVCQ